MNNKILKYFKNPINIIIFLNNKRLLILPDKIYLKILYKNIFNKKLNLDNPQTFNEKLQWLKLNDRNDIYTTMVDKDEAKRYVKKIIGAKYIIPTLGVYDDYDDINFDELPNQFVIKCTHDSGGLVICKDKRKFDKENSRKKINHCLKKNFYYDFREWPYKNIKPRIIVEKYIEDSNSKLIDYKIQCINGKVDNIFLCIDRDSDEGVKYYYFDKNWNYLNYCNYDNVNLDKLELKKPENFDEMVLVAEKLSNGFPEMRIDLYNVDGKIYFGEITLYTNAGFDTTITEEADEIMGKRLKLN